MEGSLLGSLLGILAALAGQWLAGRQPMPVPPMGTNGTNGSVVGEGVGVPFADDGPFEPVQPTHERVLEFVRGSIRPLLTLGFFAVWLGIKAVILTFALYQVPAPPLLPIFWSDEDATLFATVVGFWFGTRVLRLRR